MFSPTTTMVNSVREFMLAFDQPFFPTAEDTPCEVSALRSALISEEAREFADAPPHSVDELDAVCDLLYVVIGTALTMGIGIVEYNSGQLRVSHPPKQVIHNQVLPVVQDLDSRFPCSKVQNLALNRLAMRMVDIAKQQGYRLAEAFAEVHRSNMSKLWGDSWMAEKPFGYMAIKKGDKWLVKRPDLKVMKPPTFQPPNLLPFL